MDGLSLPLLPVAPKNTDSVDDIVLTKTIFRKYLKENCSKELSFRYLGIYASFQSHFHKF